jgi:hypothetical protein
VLVIPVPGKKRFRFVYFRERTSGTEFWLVQSKISLVINMYVYAFSLVCQRLKPQLLERSFQELDANFRSYTRALVGLACNLHRSRELRSLFLELVERCLEPWRQVSWSHTDLRNFLASYFQCALEMDVLRCVIVIVLLSTLTSCGLRCRVYMFHVNFIHKFFIISWDLVLYFQFLISVTYINRFSVKPDD